MPRLPLPSDLASLRVPTDVRLSPDGQQACFVVKEAAPDQAGYRMALWLAPVDGSAAPRQLTLGARKDAAPRWSPDGHWLAFLSDRGAVLRAGGAPRDTEDLRRAGATLPGLKDIVGRDIPRGDTQVWLLPADGGEARQLTDLPGDVGELTWSPDSTRLCIVSGAMTTKLPAGTAAAPASGARAGETPRRDVRLIDELDYQLNGVGFTYEHSPRLWIVDVASGAARRITSGSRGDEQPAWSPDGTRIAFVSNRGAGADLAWRSDVYVVPAAGGPATRVTSGRERLFRHPAWSPDGSLIAAVGHRFEALGPTRDDIWVCAPEPGQAGRNLTADSDLFVDAMMNSDLFGFGEAGPRWTPDSRAILFAAPVDGSYELWRARLEDGRVERLTSGRHMLRGADVAEHPGGLRAVAIRGSATEPPDVVSFEVPPLRATPATPVPDTAMRRLSDLMAQAWKGMILVEPQERWHEVDGRRIQGWLYEAPRRRGRPAPLVVEIHGGPATLYGWSLMWEWQVLVGAGISVYACNPRGSTGHGQAFAAANHRDWGDGPMADIEAGVDAIVAEGRADPQRLGVTGGSYGGYLAAWMIGHTDRYAAAVACRGVYDMTSEMLSGDLGGPNFGRYEFGVQPWEDPGFYRQVSPLSYATAMHTPLLIQHAEQDLRCPMTQAEELFSVLRSLRRPVRLMRTPGESHELTRSGSPFRRVENLERIRDWFVHYLVAGARTLPPTS
jgi:dipeptidyl aminopeptidase/acylaminoacyl peptidase